MKNYKDLLVWQKAHALVLAAYKATKLYPKEELYTLTSQTRRAVISVPTNIAEGCGKFTQRDLARYLQISFASCQEVEYLMFLSFELGYLSLKEFQILDEQVGEVKAMLLGLLRKVRRDELKKR